MVKVSSLLCNWGSLIRGYWGSGKKICSVGSSLFLFCKQRCRPSKYLPLQLLTAFTERYWKASRDCYIDLVCSDSASSETVPRHSGRLMWYDCIWSLSLRASLPKRALLESTDLNSKYIILESRKWKWSGSFHWVLSSRLLQQLGIPAWAWCPLPLSQSWEK